VLPEPARQVRLIGETDLCRNVCERLAVEDPIAGSLHAASQHVLVRRDPVGRGERPRQPRGARAELIGRGSKRHRLRDSDIEPCTKRFGQIEPIRWRNGDGYLAKRRPDPLGDDPDPGLRFHDILHAAERVVECRHLATQRRVGDDRMVDGPPDGRRARDAHR